MNLFQSFNHPSSDTSCFMTADPNVMQCERRFFEAKFTRPQQYSQIQEQFEQIKDQLQHPNIVNYTEIRKENGSTVLTRKYVNGENFSFYISLSNLPYDALIASARTISKIVKFVHSKGIIMKNLIPSNIIIDPSGVMYFVDIGYDAIFFDNFHETKEAVNLLFSGPEAVRNDHSPSLEKDIWCLGIILYVIITGSYPWPLKNTIKLMQLLMKAEVKIPDGMNKNLASLITQMLCPDPKKRPNAAEVYHRLKTLNQFGRCQRVTPPGNVMSTPDLPFYNNGNSNSNNGNNSNNTNNNNNVTQAGKSKVTQSMTIVPNPLLRKSPSP